MKNGGKYGENKNHCTIRHKIHKTQKNTMSAAVETKPAPIAPVTPAAVQPAQAPEKYVPRFFELKNLQYPQALSIVALDVADIRKKLLINTDKGALKFAYERLNGVLGQFVIKSPPLRVVHSGSLNGVGGQAKLKEGKGNEGKAVEKRFTVMCTDATLIHPEIYEANKAIDIKAQVAKLIAILEDVYAIFIQIKVENPTVHNKQYTKAKESADIFAAADPTQPIEKYLFVLSIQLKALARKAFHPKSTDVEKAIKIANAYDFKFSTSPFFKPAEGGKIHPVDPEILAIYNKGAGDSNPDYKYALEVVENQKKGLNFNRVHVSHVDKNVKYPVFGPFFGRGSTITVDFDIAPYASGENDGLNLYIKGILVLKDEPYVPHDDEITSDFVAPLPPAPAPAPATTGTVDANGTHPNPAGGDPDPKKQKMDADPNAAGPTTSDFGAGAK